MAITPSNNFKNMTINLIVDGEELNSPTLNRPIIQLRNLLENASFNGSIASIAIPTNNSEFESIVNDHDVITLNTTNNLYTKATDQTDVNKIVGIVTSNKTKIIVGGLLVNDNLSLTSGNLYYVQHDGSIGTTNSNIFIGIALSSNTLLLKI